MRKARRDEVIFGVHTVHAESVESCASQVSLHIALHQRIASTFGHSLVVEHLLIFLANVCPVQQTRSPKHTPSRSTVQRVTPGAR